MIKQLFTTLGLVSLAATFACEAHETVRVREPVVTEKVVVAQPQPVAVVEEVRVKPAPVIQERVVIAQPQPATVVVEEKVAKPKVIKETVVVRPAVKETVTIGVH